ncbi:hypothetical protein HID58_003571, partial [Brassica napus]
RPVQVGGTDATAPVFGGYECQKEASDDRKLYAAEQLVLDICNLKLRENALQELSKWNLHMLKTESNYHNYTLAAESGKKAMQEVVLNWYKQISKESLCDCTSMEENLRIPGEFGLNIIRCFAENLPFLLSNSLKFNNDACAKINSMIIPCCEEWIEPKSDHSHKVVEITISAWKYLLDENFWFLHTGDDRNVLWCKQVNEPSCSTPMKRPNDIPSIESRVNFQDGKLLKQASGDAKQQQQHLIRASSVYVAAVSDSKYTLSRLLTETK